MPSMAALLDAEAMGSAWQGTLHPGHPRPTVGIRQVHYKPGHKLVVHYDVAVGREARDAVALLRAKGGLEREPTKPANVALARATGAAPVAQPLSYDVRLDALLCWAPLDPQLPALSLDGHELATRLRRAGVELGVDEHDVSLLGYKPLSRAVLGLDGHVLKLYADEDDFADALTGLRTLSRRGVVATGAFCGSLPQERITVQASIEGSRPDDRLAGNAAGELLADLHRMSPVDLRSVRPSDQMAAAAHAAALVGAVLPRLRERVARLVAEIEASAPRRIPTLVTSHGDFDAGQLLQRSEGLALLDLDDVCAAPAALDLATYAAHLAEGGSSHLEAVMEVLAGLVDGYGARPPDLDWYLATSLLLRAPTPFRRFEPDWPARIEAMLDITEQAAKAITP